MIRSFRNRQAERLFHGQRVPSLPPEIHVNALAKLRQLDAAESLDDLRTPPGNHLERLREDRLGQWSIRINRQWRVCFEWRDGHAYEAEVTDYH